jgi:hypothetical protein
MKFFKSIVSFMMLFVIKYLSRLFYRFEVHWVGEKVKDWNEIKVFFLLNHTSLFEPIFCAIFPNRQLWRASQHLIVPGADITLKRPIVGKFFKNLGPDVVPITRQKDHTWDEFLQKIHPESLIAILPEGRMKRKNGLDKEGKPMTVRGGFVDILTKMRQGKILILYSGGLHHIQAPGEKYPHLFKKVKANFELLDIQEYLKSFKSEGSELKLKSMMIQDLENRIKLFTP